MIFDDLDTKEIDFNDSSYVGNSYNDEEVASAISFTDQESEYFYDSELYYDQDGVYYDGGIINNFNDNGGKVNDIDDSTYILTDTTDNSYNESILNDISGQVNTVNDIRLYGWGFDDDQIEFDSDAFLFDGDGLIEGFSDESEKDVTFNDNNYITTSFSN